MGTIIVDPKDEQAYQAMCKLMPDDFKPIDPEEVKKKAEMYKEEEMAAQIVALRALEQQQNND